MGECEPFPSVLNACRNRAAYRQPPEQLTELSRRQEEEGEDDYRHEDQRNAGRETPDQAGR